MTFLTGFSLVVACLFGEKRPPSSFPSPLSGAKASSWRKERERKGKGASLSFTKRFTASDKGDSIITILSTSATSLPAPGRSPRREREREKERDHQGAMDAAGAGRPGSLRCQWEGCSELFDEPEQLFLRESAAASQCSRSSFEEDKLKHEACFAIHWADLTDLHVGRKSTNNLCLTCKWHGCNVTCAKRDHITSHMRGGSATV